MLHSVQLCTGPVAQDQTKKSDQNKEQSVYVKDPQQNSYEGMQEKYPEWFERDKVVYPYNLDSEEMQGRFSVATILPNEFPQNSKIANLKTYCKDAGVSTTDVKVSYTAETEEPEL